MPSYEVIFCRILQVIGKGKNSPNLCIPNELSLVRRICILTNEVHSVNYSVLYSIDRKFKCVCRKGLLLQTDSLWASRAPANTLKYSISTLIQSIYTRTSTESILYKDFFTIMFIKGPVHKGHDARALFCDCIQGPLLKGLGTDILIQEALYTEVLLYQDIY